MSPWNQTRHLLAALLLSGLAPVAASAQDKIPTPYVKPEPTTASVTPYGMVLLNAYFNANTFKAADYPGQADAAQTGGAFLTSARQSRFGVNLALNDNNWSGARFKGKIEFDFKGGHFATNSMGWNAAIMRLRVAQVTATKSFGDTSLGLLAGQDYGLVTPLFATSVSWVADPIFWQAGNGWRRTPQARLIFTHTLGAFGYEVAAAVLSPADPTGTVILGAGNLSRRPDLEGRAGVSLELFKGGRVAAGFGYHTNVRRYDAGTENAQDVSATLIGADLEATFPFVGLKGEWYRSRGADDTYNGILANAVAGGPGARFALATSGFWGQLVLKPFDVVWLTAGYGQARADTDQLSESGAAGTQRDRNEQLAGGLVLNVGKMWQLGIEGCRTTTAYLDGTTQTANQLASSVKFTF